MPIRPAAFSRLFPTVHPAMGQSGRLGDQLDAGALAELKRNSSVPWLRENANFGLTTGSEAQFRCLEHMVRCISTTRVGSDLLQSVAHEARRRDKTLEIFLNAEKFCVDPLDVRNISNGVGTSASLLCKLAESSTFQPETPTGPQLQHHAVSLFVTLLSCLHMLKGNVIDAHAHDSLAHQWPHFMRERARLCGLGSFRNEPLSENAFRAELGMPRRTEVSTRDYTLHDDDTVSVNGERRSILPLPGRSQVGVSRAGGSA